MEPMIDVHLCHNNERGLPSGLLHAVAFYELGGDLLAGLEHAEGISFEAPAKRQRWVGNMLWDSTIMDNERAIKFARWLVQQGFVVTEHASDEAPWNALDQSERPGRPR
jgi:hypothetical protein